jgi:hypothetical protein
VPLIYQLAKSLQIKVVSTQCRITIFHVKTQFVVIRVLQALAWMGVCCTHIVRVFVASTINTRLSDKETRRVFLQNVLMTTLGSGVVVGVTVGVAIGVSGGQSMGYGGSLCFLGTGRLPLLTLAFTLPLGLVVLVDIVCFLFTAVSIARVRRLQSSTEMSRSEERGVSRVVLVYAKLVTVTGGAWSLGPLAEAADSGEWMRVVAELLMGAQGLLIFLAYVCNARVWRLYQGLLASRHQNGTITTGSQ